jgi:hypothetical protein
MNKPAAIQVRLPQSVKAAVERWAKIDGVSMNQLISIAVAEKISALETTEFFAKRAAGADMDAFRRFMNREGGEQPREGDELPEGYLRTRV